MASSLSAMDVHVWTPWADKEEGVPSKADETSQRVGNVRG